MCQAPTYPTKELYNQSQSSLEQQNLTSRYHYMTHGHTVSIDTCQWSAVPTHKLKIYLNTINLLNKYSKFRYKLFETFQSQNEINNFITQFA
jgi:hypothetical protein